MAAEDYVAFELKEGVTRVEVNVQSADEPLVIESGKYKAKGEEIAALDACDGVKRVKGRAPKAETPQEEPVGSTGSTA
jgi:hypothetical protein